MNWLDQVLSGTPNDETLDHLRRAFNTWLKSTTRGGRNAGGKVMRASSLSLSRCLGLPERPESVRIKRRDAYLLQASLLLTVDPSRPWRMACALHKETKRFMSHQWLCWCHLRHPPSNASDIDRLLFLATQAGGGTLPKTTRSYALILKV